MVKSKEVALELTLQIVLAAAIGISVSIVLAGATLLLAA
jgi:hypothetical protein